MPLAEVQRLNPFIVEVADIVIELNEAPPVTVSPVVVALLTEIFKADKEPRLLPPETVSPVVVALPLIKFPRFVKPVTPREPNDAPPVTPNDVEVPTVNANELSWVPPVTLNPPVEVALVKVELADEREPSEVPPLTVSPVVVAFCIKAPTPKVVEVAETENKVEVPDWPLI